MLSTPLLPMGSMGSDFWDSMILIFGFAHSYPTAAAELASYLHMQTCGAAYSGNFFFYFLFVRGVWGGIK